MIQSGDAATQAKKTSPGRYRSDLCALYNNRIQGWVCMQHCSRGASEPTTVHAKVIHSFDVDITPRFAKKGKKSSNFCTIELPGLFSPKYHCGLSPPLLVASNLSHLSKGAERPFVAVDAYALLHERHRQAGVYHQAHAPDDQPRLAGLVHVKLNAKAPTKPRRKTRRDKRLGKRALAAGTRVPNWLRGNKLQSARFRRKLQRDSQKDDNNQQQQ